MVQCLESSGKLTGFSILCLSVVPDSSAVAREAVSKSEYVKCSDESISISF